jgi:replicative DNA helicase
MSSPKPQKTPSPDGGEDLLRRVPPHSVEAECAVLGGVFLLESLFATLVDVVGSGDFYVPAHRDIFAAFEDLDRRHAPIDLVSVHEALKNSGKLESAGGAAYLAQLAENAVTGANAAYYAAIVRDRAMQRALIGACSEIVTNSFAAGGDVDNLLNESALSVMKIAERTTGKVFRSTRDLVGEVYHKLEARINSHEMLTGVTTGYARLDELTAGLQPSDLIIIAARPSMGKTAFGLNVAMRAALQDNVPVAVFSLEMSTEQIVMRMLCSWGKVDLSHLRRGWLNDEEWAKLGRAADVLSKAPIYIDDTAELTPVQLQARTRRLKAESGLGLIVVDYLQLMRVGGRRFDVREREISEISRSLKALAKEHNVPVIALAQLNRKVEDRPGKDKRPMLGDLRESGAIEQDADVIMFIYRDEVYDKRPDNPNRGKAEIIVGKQRNGPTGVVHLAYLSPYTSFEELDPQAVPSENL